MPLSEQDCPPVDSLQREVRNGFVHVLGQIV